MCGSHSVPSKVPLSNSLTYLKLVYAVWNHLKLLSAGFYYILHCISEFVSLPVDSCSRNWTVSGLDDLPMPLLDIVTAQPSLQSNLHAFWSQTIQQQSKFVIRNEKLLGFLWRKPYSMPDKANHLNSARFCVWRGGLMIKAVATLEPSNLSRRYKGEFGLRVDDVNSEASAAPWVEEQPSLSEDSDEEVDDREKLRRMRISRANKGNTPWNKGRKHTPETLRRIRERTRIAMQDPKVKMKLAKLGHAQSEETKMKIGVGVRIGWEKRREKIMLQETCLYEWQNLIAEVSRRGVLGEEELQWDSYKILDEQLEQEWVQSVEERKRTPRVKGSKRAPKSLEQRRKISESIAAKWADPAYRQRVRTGLVKYHGITEVVERTPRTTRSQDGQSRKRSPSKTNTDSDDESAKSQNLQTRRKSKSAPYKDPLVSSKLELLKSIRAQRAAAESKKTEAIVRAKLLIAEAEKAANALEAAAKQSPLARDSLIETRRLIAEAVQSISSIDEEQQEGSLNDESISLTSLQHFSQADFEMKTEFVEAYTSQINERKLNGISRTLESGNSVNSGLISGEKFKFHRESTDDDDASDSDVFLGFDLVKPSDSGVVVNGKNNSVPQMSSIKFDLGTRLSPGHAGKGHEHPELNGMKLMQQPREEETPQKMVNVMTKRKRWVRGRLVEVDGEEN